MQQAIDFLCEHPEGVLATVADNRPQTRVFQVMKAEGTTLFFATAPQKAVWQQLQANPAVEFLVLHDRVSVRCSGIALFDVDDNTKRWIYYHNPVLPSLYSSYDKLVYFRLPIARLEYFDLRPTPPINLHFDLTTGQPTMGFVGERFSVTQ
ncbi:MAG: pyridoxamine 5'-phosphate oxidase family protein [Bacteroidales bacterium]|nr:pyridoxamine 5'-phosphate oxidase family protein [Bacteroidales bacterium]